MEVFDEFVRRIVKAFDAVGLDYMFTGALAASFYGSPRTTVDVDVIVRVVEGKQRAKLVSALKKAGLVVDERKIDDVLKSGYQIATFRDKLSPFSLDVILSAKKSAKNIGTVAGLRTFFQTPEDLILAKLRMIKATVPRERALKDEEDVKAILEFTKVDVEAVKKWAGKDTTLSIFASLVG